MPKYFATLSERPEVALSRDLLLYGCHILALILEPVVVGLLKTSLGSWTRPRKLFLFSFLCIIFSVTGHTEEIEDHGLPTLRVIFEYRCKSNV